MNIEIRDLDPAVPETLATLLPVFRAAVAADAPLHATPSATYLAWYAGPQSTRNRTCVTAFDGDRPVGYGTLNHEYDTNRDLVYGDLWIRPEYRDRLTGPLLDAFKAHTRGRGGARLVLPLSEFSAADYEAAYIAAGGRSVSGERRSQLDLTKIDREQYASWAAASEKNARYEIRLWQTPTPEHLLAPLMAANEAMRDAPTGEMDFELPPLDVARRRRVEAENLAIGLSMYIIAALTEDGAVAGFHEVFVFPDSPMASVGNTGVSAAHRGRGLGLRLKAGLALALLAAEPRVESVSTWNNVDNRPMLGVNEALGYIKAEAWSNWQFDL
ncbi:MAG: GNAT family N-acetyltransferase [Catenulispora sp.]